MAKKVLVVTGDGGESYETLYAIHRLQEEGHTAVLAAPTKKRLNLVMHDFEEGWDTYVERKGYSLCSDVAIADVDSAVFDAVLIMGGRAPEYLRHNEKLLNIVREMDAAGKWIFSICHGIQVMLAAGVVQGKRVTCYEHIRFEVGACGGTWESPQAVRDGRLVTSQTWQSHPEFYRLVIACLKEPIAA